MPSIFVPVGQALTLTANATSAGSYYRINTPGTDPSEQAQLAASAAVTLGPFNEPRNYQFDSLNGDMSYSLAVSGVLTAVEDAAIALLAPLDSPTFTGTVVLPTPYTIGAVSMTATGTQLNYVAGVTSAIQTQLNAKAAVGATVIAPVDTGGAEYTAVPNTVTAVNSIITALIAAGILHIS